MIRESELSQYHRQQLASQASAYQFALVEQRARHLEMLQLERDKYTNMPLYTTSTTPNHISVVGTERLGPKSALCDTLKTLLLDRDRQVAQVLSDSRLLAGELEIYKRRCGQLCMSTCE